ncbi:MAG: cytochrome C [Cruoricaptor ignavus]|nr:cytochrome C [Cruoricaptor ignavus]
MKKLVVLVATGFLFFSCSKKEVNPNIDSNVMLEEPTQTTGEAGAEAKHEGLVLIEGADCLTCHKTDAKLVGPSYIDVANKYTDADIDMLAGKIIDGGVGNWGEIPMTPHAGMSKENAKKMVQYILSLKQ